MLTTGALASLQRSLTDLPAATLLVGAAVLAGRSRTYITGAGSADKGNLRDLRMGASYRFSQERATRFGAELHMSAQSFCLSWFGQFMSVLGFKRISTEGANFAWPFEGWIYGPILALVRGPRSIGFAGLSLLAELAYLVSRPRLDSFYWRLRLALESPHVFSAMTLSGVTLASPGICCQ